MIRAVFLLLLGMLPAGACIWDRDTLREEAKGKLDSVRAITGWFDRYPPRYYEMRLERVARELRERPEALGRHDESIGWMERKKAVLDRLPPDQTADSRYRYLSNLGTFHLLRWASKPENVRAYDLSDLKASEKLVAQALELNPGAHFGREKFQLMFIRWLLDPSNPPEYGHVNFLRLDQDVMSVPRGGMSREDFTLEEARQGITGLIQLGAAWESVDVFQTLQVCLHAGRSMSLAQLAYLREKELYDAGGRSLHPVAEVREKVVPGFFGGLRDQEKVARYFQRARAAARAREAAWLAFQEERFRAGMHPDTHPAFWDGWKEPEFPAMPYPSLPALAERNPGSALVVVLLVLIAGLAGLVLAGKKLALFFRRKSLGA